MKSGGDDTATPVTPPTPMCYCPIWTLRRRQWVYRGEGNSSLCLALPQVCLFVCLFGIVDVGWMDTWIDIWMDIWMNMWINGWINMDGYRD